MIAQALLASTAIVLLSFISEDAATISSAFSLFGGPITWPVGFAACFAGIWLGDLGLYSLARCFGKPILKSRWIARFADPAAIARCQIRFNNHASLAWLFYIPVGVYYAWLAVRHRSLTVPTSANPGIATGGFVGESKLEILDQLRRTTPQFTAEAFLVDGLTTTDRLLSLHRLCREHEITLPFILKPDVGQRGNGVRVIRSMRTALEYLQTVDAPVIVQRYVTGPCEAGVFYYRFPDKPRGHIFAITEKIFPTITGDGIHTVEEMIG